MRCLALAFFVLALAPQARGQVVDKCQAAKIKAAGKKTYDKAKCRAKALQKGLPLDSACLTKAEDKFGQAVTKADTLGLCSGTTTDLEAAVDQAVDTYATIVSTPVTTTTVIATTTTTAIGSTTTTTLACRANGTSCASNSSCCSGLCSGGVCQGGATTTTTVTSSTSTTLSTTPCGSTTYFQCGGTCPAGQTCYPFRDVDGQTSCGCAATGVPCADSSSLCTGGACPLPGQVCVGDSMSGVCVCGSP